MINYLTNLIVQIGNPNQKELIRVCTKNDALRKTLEDRFAQIVPMYCVTHMHVKAHNTFKLSNDLSICFDNIVEFEQTKSGMQDYCLIISIDSFDRDEIMNLSIRTRALTLLIRDTIKGK